MLRDIKNLFEHEEEENYYKPVRVNNFWSNILKNIGNRNKAPSAEEYLNKIRPYLKSIMNIQVTITTNNSK